MGKMIQGIASDIAKEIGREMECAAKTGGPGAPDYLRPLFEQLEAEIARRIREEGEDDDASSRAVAARLDKAKRMLSKLEGGIESESAPDRQNKGQPETKYANVGSVLKYVDEDTDKGGVKLVIMNFND